MPRADSETVAEPVKPKRLRHRQQEFVNAYVGHCNFNATRAAIAVGYSEKTARNIGSENLTKPDIINAINALIMPPEEIKNRLTEQARASIADVLDERGVFSLANARKKGTDRLLKELTSTYDKQTKRRTYKFKIHDPQAALDKLAKIHGLYIDRAEITGKDGGPVHIQSSIDLSKLSTDELFQYEQLLAKANNAA